MKLQRSRAAKSADFAEIHRNEIICRKFKPLSKPREFIHKVFGHGYIVGTSTLLKLFENEDDSISLPRNAKVKRLFKDQQIKRKRLDKTLWNPTVMPCPHDDLLSPDAIVVPIPSYDLDENWIEMLVHDLGYPASYFHTTVPSATVVELPKNVGGSRRNGKITERHFDAHIDEVAPKADEHRREALRQVIVYMKPVKSIADAYKIDYQAFKRQCSRTQAKLTAIPETKPDGDEIQETVDNFGGDRVRAAEKLGIDRSTVQRYLAEQAAEEVRDIE